MAKKGAKRDGSKSVAIQSYLDANPGVGAKAVKEALAKDGVDVSVGLVNKVKYSKPSGAKKSGGARKAKGTARRGRPKAGSGASNSDRIREYMDANPSATRPEIRDALNAQGVDVSTSLVNAVYVKYLAKQGKKVASARGGRRGRKATAPARPAAPRATGGSDLSATELLNAKGLVDQLGGIEKARQALALLEQLQ
ncbi:MAG: hypothetical protein ACYTGL_05535 [Planctomycetota bacterium]|jgi:uncharacterized protein YneF (UPF0154 family)